MRFTAIIIVAVLLLKLTGAIYRAFEPQPVAAPFLAQPVNKTQEPFSEIKTIAIHTCWDAILAGATNKSSVDFKSFTAPPAVKRLPDQSVEVFVKFSAKNGFGAGSNSIARCITSGDGGKLLEITAQDSR